MKIAITGTPGTGKTSIAKALGKALKIRLVNEKFFAGKLGVGKRDRKAKELEVDTKKLGVAINKWLEGRAKAIVEGHLLCETRLKVDWIIVLAEEPKVLEQRLEKRGYSDEKVQDNVHAQAIEYCLHKTKLNYSSKKIITISSKGKSIKEASKIIIDRITKK